MLDQPGLELEAGVVTAEVNAHTGNHGSECRRGVAAWDHGWRDRRAGPSRAVGRAHAVDAAADRRPAGRGNAPRLPPWRADVRRRNRPWPAWRSAVFVLGVAGPPLGELRVRAGLRGLALLGVDGADAHAVAGRARSSCCPGHPVQLARAIGGTDSRLDRLLRSRFARVVGNPLVGPALVPLLSGVLFFGPLPGGRSRRHRPAGCCSSPCWSSARLMVLPLVGLDEDAVVAGRRPVAGDRLVRARARRAARRRCCGCTPAWSPAGSTPRSIALMDAARAARPADRRGDPVVHR